VSEIPAKDRQKVEASFIQSVVQNDRFELENGVFGLAETLRNEVRKEIRWIAF
jgi:vacuolar-type H+-ATPase subunit E/Vma4